MLSNRNSPNKEPQTPEPNNNGTPDIESDPFQTLIEGSPEYKATGEEDDNLILELMALNGESTHMRRQRFMSLQDQPLLNGQALDILNS